jgi:hypothetical protein
MKIMFEPVNLMADTYLRYSRSFQKAFFVQLKAFFMARYNKTFNSKGSIADVNNLGVYGGHAIVNKSNFIAHGSKKKLSSDRQF